MKLIGTYFSPFARRVGAALIALDIPFDHDALHGYKNAARTRELNPVGKVPMLVLEDGETLIDSTVILDYINELAGPERSLIPPSGLERRAMLKLAAISTTICEQGTAHYFENQRSKDCIQPDLLERYCLQITGGLRVLDAASGVNSLICQTPLNLATLSAVVAFEYIQMIQPELEPAAIAPNLAQVAHSLSQEPAFQQTR